MPMQINFDFVEALDDFSSFNESLDKYNYIPAVKHRALLAEVCENLENMGGISLICPAIVLDNGRIFYMSNNPALAAAYMETGLYRADNYFNVALQSQASHFFPNNANAASNDLLQKMVLTVLEEKFKVHNTYCLIRRCMDCTVIVGVTHNHPVSDKEKLYKETISDVEQLIIKFFDKTIDIYLDELTTLKPSRFATDSHFREAILTNRQPVDLSYQRLTDREKECLYWISLGKTSAELAVLMNISELTANQHKKNILSKMGTSNMVQAVKEAIRFKIIT